MTDLLDQISAVHRSVTSHTIEGEDARSVILSQTYPYAAAEVWHAITTADRIARWIGGQVTGELHLGGRYQIEHNAAGTVLACEEPRHLRVSWEFGGGTSWVDAGLVEQDGSTTLTIEHAAVVGPHWTEFGPGAVGIGWDLMVLGLATHLAGAQNPATAEEAQAFGATPEAIEFMTRSSDGWTTADEGCGTKSDDARRRAAATLAFYTGQSS